MSLRPATNYSRHYGNCRKDTSSDTSNMLADISTNEHNWTALSAVSLARGIRPNWPRRVDNSPSNWLTVINQRRVIDWAHRTRRLCNGPACSGTVVAFANVTAPRRIVRLQANQTLRKLAPRDSFCGQRKRARSTAKGFPQWWTQRSNIYETSKYG